MLEAPQNAATIAPLGDDGGFCVDIFVGAGREPAPKPLELHLGGSKPKCFFKVIYRSIGKFKPIYRMNTADRKYTTPQYKNPRPRNQGQSAAHPPRLLRGNAARLCCVDGTRPHGAAGCTAPPMLGRRQSRYPFRTQARNFSKPQKMPHGTLAAKKICLAAVRKECRPFRLKSRLQDYRTKVKSFTSAPGKRLLEVPRPP